MPGQPVTTAENDIIESLTNAGFKGLSKTQLKLISKTRQEAFKALLDSNRIENIGSQSRPRYVTQDFFQPLEIACDLILAQAKPGQLKTFTRKQIADSLTGVFQEKADEAVERLVEEKKLLALKCSGKDYFLHASSTAAYLGLVEKGTEPPAEDSAKPQVKVKPETEPAPEVPALTQPSDGSDDEVYRFKQASNLFITAFKDYLSLMGRRTIKALRL